MNEHQDTLDIIIKTCECNICWETKKKFKLLKCNHKVCTTCFPQIRNNLCPYCRTPINIRSSQNINIPHINYANNFSNLSLDDSLLLNYDLCASNHSN